MSTYNNYGYRNSSSHSYLEHSSTYPHISGGYSFTHAQLPDNQHNTHVYTFLNKPWYPSTPVGIYCLYFFYTSILGFYTYFIIQSNRAELLNWDNKPLDVKTSFVYLFSWVDIALMVYALVAIIDLFYRDLSNQFLHKTKDFFYFSISGAAYALTFFYFVYCFDARLSTSVNTISSYLRDFAGYLLPAVIIFIAGASINHKATTYKFVLVCGFVASLIFAAYFIDIHAVFQNREEWPYYFQVKPNPSIHYMVTTAFVLIFALASYAINLKLWPEYTTTDTTPLLN